MENRAAKRREKGDDDEVGSDRISQLPESVLLHILCFVSHKKAVQTSVLSKSWRHLGPTRPVIRIREDCGVHPNPRRIIGGGCEDCFDGKNEAFTSFLDKTLQRYSDLNLFTQEIDLKVTPNSKSISVLQKWIPMFINPDKPAVTKFRLKFNGESSFNLPSIVLKAESLRELDLSMCKIDSIDNVVLKNLQKLTLFLVQISNEALEKIIAGCPLLKHVVLYLCVGFRTINIGNKNRHLNYLEHFSFIGDNPGTSVEIHAPTLQSIRIVSCFNWYRGHNNYYFPNLKSLFLLQVELPTELFVNFSCNFPRLEELTLLDCHGFEEIKLSSCSIKHLTIRSGFSIKKVDVEVPNILYFEFSSTSLSTALSLRTTSTEWKSNLALGHCDRDGVLPRIHKLFEMVKALSQSQISLTLFHSFFLEMKQMKWDINDHPVVVEHLSLDMGKLYPDSPTHFLDALLCIFRPRYINAVSSYEEEVTEFLWKNLMHKREKTNYGWDQHLKEVSIEASDRDGLVWHHVQWSRLPEWSKNQKIRFQLKWRDLVDC